MNRYTVLIIPEGHSSVRRFHVAAERVRRLAWGAGICALLLAVGMVDYVRARIRD